MEKKWYVDVDEFQHEIRIKGDDTLQRPIATIARPTNVDWMNNVDWFNKAMEKAELAAAAPELLDALKDLLVYCRNNSTSQLEPLIKRADKIIDKLKPIK